MYVVAGVSGRTGSVVADALLAAGQPVRVVVRKPADGGPWLARGAEVAVASLEDAEALAAALAGANGVYLLSPEDPRREDPIAHGWRIADAIARALGASAPAHAVLLSARGAELAEGAGLLGRLHALETRLGEATCALTFLRAATLLDTFVPAFTVAAASGRLPTFLRPDVALPMVATRDVGLAAARALLEGPPVSGRAVIELRGPREVSPHALAQALADALGRPIEVEAAPLAAVEPMMRGFGASLGYAAALREVFAALNEDRVSGNGARLVRGGVTPEAFVAAFLTRAVRA